VRESRPPGSVREVLSNGHPYRDDTLSPSGDCEVNFYDSRAIVAVMTCVVPEEG
jgi:hypothetical protein